MVTMVQHAALSILLANNPLILLKVLTVHAPKIKVQAILNSFLIRVLEAENVWNAANLGAAIEKFDNNAFLIGLRDFPI